MEYIQNKPDNLNMYIDEFHTSIKAEFEKSINKMYNEEEITKRILWIF